jgi:hypothetical protein
MFLLRNFAVVMSLEIPRTIPPRELLILLLRYFVAVLYVSTHMP